MMLKKTRVKLLESEIVTYPTTQMMRNLLVAQVCTVKTHSRSCLLQLHLPVDEAEWIVGTNQV